MKVLIVYYSTYGNVYKMAQLGGRGGPGGGRGRTRHRAPCRELIPAGGHPVAAPT